MANETGSALFADTLLNVGEDTGQEAAPSTELQAVRDELVKLATIAAHQLKSPLNSITTTLSLLSGGFAGPVPANQRELLEAASRSATRGTELVSDLLRLRGLDVLSVEDLVPVNAIDSLHIALERVRDTAKAGQVELLDTVQIDDSDLGWVVAEAGVVQEVLYVLLENAVKYTPTGGRVRVRLYVPSPAIQLPRTATPFGQIACEVIDSGIGIPPKAWPSIFTEFFRASNARGLSREGTGLGLAFAERATRLLSGRLRLEPASTGGVRSLVVLPTAAPGAADRTGEWPVEREVSQRVVVVGGVAAGAKAAARIARLDLDAEVTVVERGQFLTYAGCGLPYYISGSVRDQRALLSSPLGVVRDSSFFHALKSVKTLDFTEAVSIDRQGCRVKVRRRSDGQEMDLPYDHLVLATGAKAAIPPIPGVDLPGVYTLHGPEDAEAIRTELMDQRAKEVAIVGGGLLGVTITESVALRGSRINLIEAQQSILGIVDPDLAGLVQRHMERQGVRISTGCPVKAIEGEGRARAIRLCDGSTIPCDFVILAAGVRPETSLAQAAGLEIGPTGAIKVDRRMRSSDPRIYAVGDCGEDHHLLTDEPTWIPLGSTANKEGRVAAGNICGRDTEFPGVVGSMVLGVFDWTVATTGLSSDEAARAGFDPVTALIPSPDRAHYLPTARPIFLKLVADRQSRRVLGLQGVGPGEVAKRIDIVATAISAGMDLEAMSHLDLAYAPPYSLALDNVITAANVLQNQLDGLFEGITSMELQARLQEPDPPILLDVRLPSEFGSVRLPESLHIPLGALRGRLHEIPDDREIVTIGKLGLRAYEAALALRHHGHQRVRVLEGGLDAWPFALEQL
jgi:NADPH-dependent 2,4-dienoyl-CoA reductase/sulfur reductase-like enzyme/signal transduction histidine kinase/rhodanese-related sulfurtransferase